MITASVQHKATIPRLYADVVTLDTDRLVVEHAALPKTRLPETLIARAISEATSIRDKSIALLTPAPSRDRFTTEQALRVAFNGKVPRAFSMSGCVAYQCSSLLWILDAKKSVSGLPFMTLDLLVVVDAEQIDEATFRSLDLVARRRIVSTAPVRASQWLYRYARREDTTLLRFTAPQIIERFPDQADFALPTRDPDYSRTMMCEDESEVGEQYPFSCFARKRLKVRTDKTNAFLSPSQLLEAKAQGSTGAPIVTFEQSKLQRRYRAQKRLAVMKGKKPWFLLLKYRRGGFTTLEQAENYYTSVTYPRSYVAALADTREKTQRIFRIAKLYHEKDPRAPRLVGDSKTQLEFSNGSLYFIGTAGSSGFARGDTLQRAHGSEVSKWCHGDPDQVSEVMAGILGACEHGTIVLETTANGIEWFAHTYRDAKQGRNDFTPIFLRWFDDATNRIVGADREEILDTLDAREQALVQNFNLDHEQIAFRRDRKRAFGKLFPQEYPEDDDTCFIVSGTPYFDVELVKLLIDTISASPLVDTPNGVMPKGAKSIPGGYLMEWESPQPGVTYVIGADTSEGIPGCDPSGFGVMRKDTGAQVAAAHGYFDPRQLAHLLCEASDRWNKALIGVERENHGHAVIQKVIDLGIHTPHFKGGRLYWHSHGEPKDREDRKAKAGWSTNAITRPVMLDHLAEYIEAPDALDRIRDRHFLSECLTFRKQSNGRWEHDPGCHDDALFKWAIAEQMRRVRIRKPEIIIV